ncbi:MAG: S1C family serine protease [Polyangiaceae bacterium]
MDDTFDIEDIGVFQVFTGAGTGSGFLIDDRHLVTNCHVVAPYRTVAVELRDRRRIVAHVRRIHPRRDLAALELTQALPLAAPADDDEDAPIAEPPGTPTDRTVALQERPAADRERAFVVLGLGLSEDVRPKQPVNILGFPVGLPLSLTEGVISHPNQLFDGQRFLQTDAAINPGNSGGPILNHHRRIVGVTTCKHARADLVGFGIPSSDVERFVTAFRAQGATFGVECPACEMLIETSTRYCAACGSDLEELEISAYFETPEPHPVAAFVEKALLHANVDPVLARHGEQNWSFYSGSAPIKIWSCCSEHLCFSSPLAQPGKRALGDLFRYLLSPEHEPFAFDLDGNVIRLNLTVHMSDVFSPHGHDAMASWIDKFVRTADVMDNRLISRFGCEPAPETQLTFLKDGPIVGPPSARH